MCYNRVDYLHVNIDQYPAFFLIKEHSSHGLAQRLERLHRLPVKDQLYNRQAIMAFRCMTGHAPEYLTSQFLPREQVSKRTTRSSQKLNIPLFRSASQKRTFYYRAIKLWNNFEPSLKTSHCVQVFSQSPSAFNDGDHLTWSKT